MVNVGTIMDNIKAVLDADSTLDTLLGVVGSGSKVIVGAELPSNAAPPLINLVDMTESVTDPDTAWTEIILGVVVRAENKAENLPNYTAIGSIGNRINTLLDSQELSGARAVLYTGAMQMTPDLEHDGVSMKQYRYAILGL